MGQDPGGREGAFGLTTLQGRSNGVCSVSLQYSARVATATVTVTPP